MRVNNIVLGVPQAIACMDFVWDDARIVEQLINACLIQEELEREPVEISDDDLQVAVDQFRGRHGLYTVAETVAWMELRGMTQAQLEDLVADDLKVAKLRDRVTEGLVTRYFDDHRSEFDTVRALRIPCGSARVAAEALQRLDSGDADVFELAQSCSLTDGATVPTFSAMRRRELPGSLRDAYMEAGTSYLAAGEIVYVIGVDCAQLDAATAAAIQQSLFEDWLAARRRDARIEWNWGTA